jgi:threonine synthase
MPRVRCVDCQKEYPEKGVPFRCPDCGGIYDYDAPPVIDARKLETSPRSIWHYIESFDLFKDAVEISLGEGNTPLVHDQYASKKIAYKMESLNPTGSYKDRGTAVMMSQILARGISAAVEDSSGNAGASFAAYCARAEINGRVYVPESTSQAKCSQIQVFGADLIRVPGLRAAAAQAVLKDAKAGAVYASHAYLPFGLPGIATIAYEIYDQLGEAPGTVISPVGHGSLLLGIIRGFQALENAGLVERQPYYLGVQADECKPLATAFRDGKEKLVELEFGKSAAEGVCVSQPVRMDALIREIKETAGEIITVEEDQILPAYELLATRGIFVEPTSALTFAALQKRVTKLPEPIVLILTGSGLKYHN